MTDVEFLWRLGKSYGADLERRTHLFVYTLFDAEGSEIRCIEDAQEGLTVI